MHPSLPLLLSSVLLACSSKDPPPAPMDFHGLPAPELVGNPASKGIPWQLTDHCLGTYPAVDYRLPSGQVCGVTDKDGVLERALYGFADETPLAELRARFGGRDPTTADRMAIETYSAPPPVTVLDLGRSKAGPPLRASINGNQLFVYVDWGAD